MTITPVSGFSVNRISPVNFGSRNKNVEPSQPPAHRDSSSAYKRVPVIVLLAMSPVAVNNSFSKAPADFEPNKIETVQQQKRNGYGYYKKHTVKSGYETCVFSHYDMDRDKNTAEVLAFSYNFDSEGGYKGRLKGYFQAIAAKPDADDRVLATYVGLDGDKIEGKPRICKIPIKFALYILDFINSGENNGAVVIAENELFEKAFGRKKIANAPRIEDEINIIQDSDGTRRSIKRPSEK